MNASQSPIRRSNRIANKEIKVQDLGSVKYSREPRIPRKAMVFVFVWLILASIALHFTFESLDYQSGRLLIASLTEWHYFANYALWYRLFCCCVIWSQFIIFYTTRPNETKVVSDLSQEPRVLTKFSEWNLFYAFTVWCWTLQGCYFAMSIAISMGLDNLYLAEATLIFFELSLSFALLVTVVVSFVLIPGGLKNKHNMSQMFSTRPLLMHNANVLFMTVELVNSKIKFNLKHFPFAILFGLAYVVFSWYIGNF